MIKFNAGSLKVVLRHLNVAKASERKAAAMCVLAAGRELRDAAKQNISLTDHSLQDLADLDHPYARRHGAIRLHGSGSSSIAYPSSRVHKQSGRLLRSLQAAPTNNGLGYRVGFDTAIAPHATFVVQGTKTMLPRDVLWHTAISPLVRKRMMTAIVRVLGKQLRSQGGVRFGSGGRGGVGP